MHEELGKVESVSLGIEDHGILTFFLHMDFGGTGQGFGGYCLDGFDKKKDRRVGTAGGMDLILQLIDMFGVKDWKNIKGKYAIALREEPFGYIKGIKMPKVDGGKVLLLEDWQKEWFPKKKAKKLVEEVFEEDD